MPATQKRKKTADMPDSPPKRVTRARAKASDEPASKAKTVKVMTPSAKAAAKKEKPVEAAKITKRKTRADDENTETIEEPAVEQPAKTRGRAKKVEEKAEESGPALEVLKKTRGRQAKPAEADEAKPTAPKTRGRSKKAEVPAESKLPIPSGPEKSEPARAMTRARAPSVKLAATIKAPAKTVNLKSAALKKKVTFQDEAEKDKENAPIGLKKPAAKATGLRAKPIRKPAATKATTRGKKAVPAKAQSQTEGQGDRVLPLSPKKVVQMAKSSSVSSEDELCGEKTPTRALSQSPVKPPPSSARPLDKPASKLDFGTMAAPSSPIKSAAPTVLQSPARRPPLSPFKDAMKSSPRKANLGEATPRPVLLFPQSTVKSTMKDSPKRGVVPIALAQPVFLSKTPMKTSLLQSPARRPNGSPMKASALQSPTKSSVAEPSMENTASPKQDETTETVQSSPQEASSSPLRAARSPGSPIRVHKITQAEQVSHTKSIACDPILQGSHDVLNEVDTFSQGSLANGDRGDELHHVEGEDDLRSPTPSPIGEFRYTPELESSARRSRIQEDETRPSDHRSTTPPGPIPLVAPAFSLDSPAFCCAVDESDSEDELASPQKVFLATPLKNHGISTQDFAISATNTSAASNRRSSLRQATNRQPLAMTPLAVQMSAWLASSPEKKDPSESAQADQLVLSPTDPTFHESPAKTSFFDDQMALSDINNDTIVDVEMGGPENVQGAVGASQESQSFEEYGDENAIPVDPQLVVMQQTPQEQTVTCTPAKVFYAQPREIHTVSKVPLRPAGDESPLKLPRKRSRSVGGPLASGDAFRVASAPLVVVEPAEKQDATPVKGQARSKPTSPVKPRSSNDDSLIETPRTLRKGGSSNVLWGAVVYVDVHTSEGEDASGIFLELLTQMGARCVKQWSWNPRANMTGPADGETSPSQSDLSNSKVGITHVVFKDGGKRTMEKVRESKGAVACVGVGWVLE